jgi:hypothetical protein
VLEVDLRSGALVYPANAHGAAAASAAVPDRAVTQDAAVEVAPVQTRLFEPVVQAVSQELWDRPTWAAELSAKPDRDDRFHVRERVTVDASTGEVVPVSRT